MSTRLYVGNLSFNSTEADLRELFSQFGTVEDAALVTDRMTGNSRGFAFVTMGSADEANTAADALNGRDFQGRNLTVNEARPREEASKFGPPKKKFGGGGGNRDFRGGGRRY
jgi:RNA-binding proteins (RRM domain)